MDMNKIKVKARSLCNDLRFAEGGAVRRKHAAKRTRIIQITKSAEKNSEDMYTYTVEILDNEDNRYDFEDLVAEEYLFDTLCERFQMLESMCE